ncbi:MAG: hypothetical protein LBJ91_07425 [Clostridiales Family XIII bacterium]|jgi:hypothetical protein|nr:hypothetical protein [Clostridiales Family XIII bacterium]
MTGIAENFKLWLQRSMFKPGRPVLTVVPLLILAAIVAIVIFIVMRLGAYSIDEPIYRFENGARYDYTGATEIKRDDEDGAVYLNNNDESIRLEDAPIYYDDDAGSVLLPQQMIYVDTATLRTGRTGYNTLVNVDATGKGTALVNRNKVGIDKGFFYDGRNTYVFIEPVTVSWGGQTVELQPLSYAIVHYNLRLELYSADGETVVVEQTGNSRVQAISADGGFTIDMGTDVLVTDKGESLLTTRPDLLDYLS